MTVALVTFSKSGTRKEFTIKNGETVIGRKTDADLRIPLNEISRSHCELSVTDDGVILRDLDSRNGTFLNDEEISEAPIKAGDRIRLGPVVFVVQIDGEPKDISVPSSAPVAAPKVADVPPPGDAPSDGATAITSSSPADGSGFDIETIDEDLDIEELGDLDLDEIDELEDSDELEEIDELEELSDEDISETKDN